MKLRQVQKGKIRTPKYHLTLHTPAASYEFSQYASQLLIQCLDSPVMGCDQPYILAKMKSSKKNVRRILPH